MRMSQCKTWTVPAGFFLGLCQMVFNPAQGQGSCPICVVPVVEEV